MNKKIKIALIVIAVLGVLGFLLFQNNGEQQSNITGMPVTDSSSTQSIQDALTKVGSVACDYKDAEGRSYKVYIKNGKIRSDISSGKNNETGGVIVRDNRVYYWSSEGAYLIKIPDESDNTNQGAVQKQQMVQSLEKYKEYCKTATVDDSKFDIPTNLKFQDVTSLMQQQQQKQGQGSGY